MGDSYSPTFSLPKIITKACLRSNYAIHIGINKYSIARKYKIVHIIYSVSLANSQLSSFQCSKNFLDERFTRSR